jgi:hypothetical protein
MSVTSEPSVNYALISDFVDHAVKHGKFGRLPRHTRNQGVSFQHPVRGVAYLDDNEANLAVQKACKVVTDLKQTTRALTADQLVSTTLGLNEVYPHMSRKDAETGLALSGLADFAMTAVTQKIDTQEAGSPVQKKSVAQLCALAQVKAGSAEDDTARKRRYFDTIVKATNVPAAWKLNAMAAVPEAVKTQGGPDIVRHIGLNALAVGPAHAYQAIKLLHSKLDPATAAWVSSEKDAALRRLHATQKVGWRSSVRRDLL